MHLLLLLLTAPGLAFQQGLHPCPSPPSRTRADNHTTVDLNLLTCLETAPCIFLFCVHTYLHTHYCTRTCADTYMHTQSRSQEPVQPGRVHSTSCTGVVSSCPCPQGFKNCPGRQGAGGGGGGPRRTHLPPGTFSSPTPAFCHLPMSGPCR